MSKNLNFKDWYTEKNPGEFQFNVVDVAQLAGVEVVREPGFFASSDGKFLGEGTKAAATYTLIDDKGTWFETIEGNSTDGVTSNGWYRPRIDGGFLEFNFEYHFKTCNRSGLFADFVHQAGIPARIRHALPEPVIVLPVPDWCVVEPCDCMGDGSHAAQSRFMFASEARRLTKEFTAELKRAQLATYSTTFPVRYWKV